MDNIANEPQPPENSFPYDETQRMWQFAIGLGGLHFYDGHTTFSFQGNLNLIAQSFLEKIPGVPFVNLTPSQFSLGSAQVHRSSPGSLHFTLQDGHERPTFTLRHSGGNL
jgi:hypothetical protein